MSLTYSFNSIPDIYEKLKRDASALENEVNGDSFFNFVTTGYSMIDWVKNDPKVPSSAKDTLQIQTLYDNQWLKVCGDIANSSKHFTLDEKRAKKSVTSSVTSQQGFGVGRFDKAGFGVGEEDITILLNDGREFGCLYFIHQVLESWEQFFNLHGI